MKRFNASKVKCSTHLVPSSERQKAAIRRERGIKQRWAVDDGPIERSTVVEYRESHVPIREDYVPCRLRGRSGTRLSPEKRALVAARREGRKAFFAELGVSV